MVPTSSVGETNDKPFLGGRPQAAGLHLDRAPARHRAMTGRVLRVVPGKRRGTPRRRILATASVLVLSIVAAACSSTDSPVPAPTAPAAPTPLKVTAAPPPPPGATGPPAIAINTLPPVPVGSPTTFRDVGIAATVTDVEQVQLEARIPGETAGPGVGVTIELRNDTKAPVDLGGLAVNAYYGDGTPANANSSPPSAPASGSVQPGESGRGVYAFRIPAEQVSSLVVELNYNRSADVLTIRR